MKKLLLVTMIILYSGIIYSQETRTLNSALGIPFGSSKSVVKSTIKEKHPDSKVYSETDMSISFEEVKYGAYKPILVNFQFTKEGQFHTCKVFVDADDCKEIFTLYDDLVKVIDEKYYTTDEKMENYKYPFTKSDKYKHTESLVKGKYVSMFSLWVFPTDKEKNNAISVEVDKSCAVKVTYQDGNLISKVIEDKKKNDSGDY